MTFGWHEGVFDALLCLDTYLGRPRVDRVLAGVRRRNSTRLLERVRAAAGAAPPLDVRVDLEPGAFRSEYLAPQRPVLLKGIAKDFVAVGRWSPELLRDRYGDMRLLTVDGRERAVEDEHAGVGEVRTSEMSLGEQVDRMLAGKFDYVSFWTELFTQHPELADDLDVDRLREYVRPARWARRPVFKLFMGGAGTSTQWHCAELQNLFLQIYGTKKWMLCPPAWTPCLDPRIVSLSQQYCHSMIDFRDPDLERYPMYRHAPLRSVLLEPGDILYVPPFWWHCVTNPEASIGLAIWWLNLIPALRSHPVLFWLTVLSPQHVWRQVKERLQRKDHRTAVSTATIFRAHRD